MASCPPRSPTSCPPHMGREASTCVCSGTHTVGPYRCPLPSSSVSSKCQVSGTASSLKLGIWGEGSGSPPPGPRPTLSLDARGCPFCPRRLGHSGLRAARAPWPPGCRFGHRGPTQRGTHRAEVMRRTLRPSAGLTCHLPEGQAVGPGVCPPSPHTRPPVVWRMGKRALQTWQDSVRRSPKHEHGGQGRPGPQQVLPVSIGHLTNATRCPWAPVCAGFHPRP